LSVQWGRASGGEYTELRQNIQQMKKTERLTAAGQLAASLAHEIRNPLASISGAQVFWPAGRRPLRIAKSASIS